MICNRMYKIEVFMLLLPALCSIVPDADLLDCGPQKNLHDCNVHDVVTLNDYDWQANRTRYLIIIAKLFEHFTYPNI